MNSKKELLIIIPTYNEKDNIPIVIKNIFFYVKNFTLLFIDDNSPDGTHLVIKNYIKNKKNVKLIIRKKKLGIGSAHKQGIIWGYKKKFLKIITMDCDGTHNPKYIPIMLKKINSCDLLITSRFKKHDSLKDWPLYRRILTYLRHFILNIILNISLDSSGAYRCYDVKKINIKDILLSKNNSYSFFWESIFLLTKKKYIIKEIPVILPARSIGNSKMGIKDIFLAFNYLIRVFFKIN
jgi:dolichol-phosphate mannosyltransferase